MKTFLTVLLFAWSVGAAAQFEGLLFEDYVYVDNIKSVKLHIRDLVTSVPIVRLGEMESLSLTFDDMDAYPKFYRYTVIQCNRDWTPSQLWFREYVDGFEDEEIRNSANSVNTFINYTHYWLNFPNDELNITKSGNYLLVVFDQANPSQPVITRRFMIVESQAIIRARRMRPAAVSKMNTHHEIRFEVDMKDVRPLPRNPKVEVTASILQNGRWDNAVKDLVSRREQGNLLIYDDIDAVTFPAGKEFRSLDIRSTQYRSINVFELRREEDHIMAIVDLDKPRALEPFFFAFDLNGAFYINTTDFGDNVIHGVRADYLDVVFTLETGREYAEDVYLFGQFTDWRLQEQYKLYYDENYQAYTTSAWLKQGYYDYIYALGNPDGSADEATIEGNWHEATNSYTILVYYRPFGARYDQLIGAFNVE